MYWTYLHRELRGRLTHTVIVAIGLAVAVALVIVVNALSAGVRDAQSAALSSVYGVGTDLTVTGAQSEPGAGGGPRFEFDEDAGGTGAEGETTLSQSRLMTDMMRGTLDASAVATAAATDGVAAATGALSLTNTTFSGELPQRPDEDAATDTGDTTEGAMPQGPGGGSGGGGFGGGSFGVDAVTVLGIEPGVSDIGPLSAVTVTDGRALSAEDAGEAVAVVDETYATGEGLAVGDEIDLGGTAVAVVGIVASSTADADAAANVFVPLDLAQELSGAGEVVSTVYVQASSADAIDAVRDDLAEALPEATVSSQSDLAATVSGSLSSAGSLITGLGTWLSVIVLAVAVALAVLFTLSGVSRRTREIGTLRSIGWSRSRIVGQVAGESIVQSVLGGIAGIVLGAGAALTITLVAPTVSAASAAPESTTPGGGGPGGPGGFGGAVAETATDIVLSAPLSVGIIGAALLLAIAGGLIAGAAGGWRAARLRPADALRTVS